MLNKLLFVLVLVIIVLFMIFSKFIILWMSAIIAGAPISLFRLIGMRSRGISANDVVKAYLLSNKAGLKLTIDNIEQIATEGSDIQNVVLGLTAADQASYPLTLSKAIQLDKQGQNIIHYVKQKVTL